MLPVIETFTEDMKQVNTLLQLATITRNILQKLTIKDIQVVTLPDNYFKFKFVTEDGTTIETNAVFIGEAISIDNVLSTISTNPVQNKVITEAINTINTSITALQGTSLSSAEKEFVSSEYKKTLNLWDEVSEVGGISDTTGENTYGTSNRRSKNLIKVDPSTAYHFLWNSYTTGSSISIGIYQYDANGDFISDSAIFSYGMERDFTTLPNCENIRFRIYNNEWTNLSTPTLDIIISKGSQNVGYHQYNGHILHDVDVKGANLWENGNPNADFAAATLTFDLTRYKYLLFEFKPTKDQVYSRQYVKALNTSGYVYISANSAQDVYSREVHIGATGVEIRGGYINATSSDSACIITAIYGIK